MKRLSIKTIVLFLTLFLGTNLAYAKDKASISYIGNTEVSLNETFTVKVQVSDIEGLPIIGIGGQVIYDQEYLEFINISGMEEPFPMRYNEKYLIFSGFSMEAKGIKDDTDILTITFKAIKVGTTNLSFLEPELSDYNTEIIKTIEVPFTLTISDRLDNENNEETIKEEFILKDNNEINAEEPNILENNKIEKNNEEIIEVTTTKNTNANESSTLEISKDDITINIEKMTNFFTTFKNLILNKNIETNSHNEDKSFLVKISKIIENIFSLKKKL